MGKCNFNPRWLSEKDTSGQVISTWAVKCDNESVMCKVCDKKVLTCRGIQSLFQHARGEKHVKHIKLKLGPNQLHLEQRTNINNDVKSIDGQPSHIVQLCSVKDSATVAELIWTMKAVSANYSFNSCDGIADTFRAMFPGLTQDLFSMSSTKMRYLCTEALAPFFKEKLLDDVQGAYYTLCFDETTNKSGEKELQIQVRYWSNREDCIVSRHLNTSYLGHATADILYQQITKTLNETNLSKHKLLMLGADGPNVNKKVQRLMNEDALVYRGISLIDIGSCNIHLIHNAFLKGLECLGNKTADLVVAIKQFFKNNPSRWDDYEKIQAQFKLPKHRFIKHVSSRWLTLKDAAARLIEQWSAIIEYFLKHIPKKCSHMEKTSIYKTILTLLKNPTIKAESHFVIANAIVFEKFTGTFQKNEPLIHLLYSEITTLLSTLLSRFCKPSILIENILKQSKIDLYTFLQQSQYLLELKNIDVGHEAKKEIKKLSEQDQLVFLNTCQKYYLASCTHILNKCPLSNSLLKYVRCLQPKLINTMSDSDIAKIAQMINLPIDSISDEWKLLRIDIDRPQYNANDRIEVFWRNVFTLKRDSGDFKYPILTSLVKAVLSLSHGNADVERGFSLSGRILTKDRASMSEKMLNSLLFIYDGLRFYNKPENVPISKKLIQLAHGARQKYALYLERKKLEEQEMLKRQTEKEQQLKKDRENVEKLKREKTELLEMEKKIAEEEVKREVQKKTYSTILDEASRKLKQALLKNDLVQASIAQTMLESANQIRQEETEKQKILNKTKKQVEKRKTSLLEEFVSGKKPKNKNCK